MKESENAPAIGANLVIINGNGNNVMGRYSCGVSEGFVLDLMRTKDQQINALILLIEEKNRQINNLLRELNKEP